ncbi:MAG: hydroxymethylbilane synthase [Chthoniobacterales bacterium]
MPGRITLGSRGSDLARAQTRLVEQALREAWPNLEVAMEIIRTSGDESALGAPITDRKAGRKGLFTREIEKKLLVRRIDVAVHSAKDLPSERRDDLEVRATLPRAATEDVLITRTGAGLTSLAEGSVLATGSVRRQRQLGWIRPDLQIVDLRGNVPTRLRKLRENESWSGIILARAGLERLGLKVEGEILSPDDFVPAGGQGVIALQVRSDDARVQEVIDAINERETHLCLRAEFEFLRLLDGDCDSPVGVQAKVEAGELRLQAQVFEAPGTPPRVGKMAGAAQDPEAIAAKLMKQLYGG